MRSFKSSTVRTATDWPDLVGTLAQPASPQRVVNLGERRSCFVAHTRISAVLLAARILPAPAAKPFGPPTFEFTVGLGAAVDVRVGGC